MQNDQTICAAEATVTRSVTSGRWVADEFGQRCYACLPLRKRGCGHMPIPCVAGLHSLNLDPATSMPYSRHKKAWIYV